MKKLLVLIIVLSIVCTPVMAEWNIEDEAAAAIDKAEEKIAYVTSELYKLDNDVAQDDIEDHLSEAESYLEDAVDLYDAESYEDALAFAEDSYAAGAEAYLHLQDARNDQKTADSTQQQALEWLNEAEDKIQLVESEVAKKDIDNADIDWLVDQAREKLDYAENQYDEGDYGPAQERAEHAYNKAAEAWQKIASIANSEPKVEKDSSYQQPVTTKYEYTNKQCTTTDEDAELLMQLQTRLKSAFANRPDQAEVWKVKIGLIRQRVTYGGRVWCILDQLHTYLGELIDQADPDQEGRDFLRKLQDKLAND